MTRPVRTMTRDEFLAAALAALDVRPMTTSVPQPILTWSRPAPAEVSDAA